MVHLFILEDLLRHEAKDFFKYSFKELLLETANENDSIKSLETRLHAIRFDNSPERRNRQELSLHLFTSSD